MKLENMEFLKAMLSQMNTNMKANQEHMQNMLARMDASSKDDAEEMKKIYRQGWKPR
jgi:hypothetical protein